MQKEEFGDRLDAAVSINEKTKALIETVPLLHLARREDQEMLCAVMTAPDDPKMVVHVLMSVAGRSNLIVVYTRPDLFEKPGMRVYGAVNLARMSGKELIEDLFIRKTLGGLIFNPRSTSTGVDCHQPPCRAWGHDRETCYAPSVMGKG